MFTNRRANPSASRLTRFQLLGIIASLLFTVIAGKLVWLQAVQGKLYEKLAEEQNSRGVVLPARRGQIFARDARTAELTPLAQNSTTYTIFIDPLLVENPATAADKLAPLLAQFFAAEAAEAEAAPAVDLQVQPKTQPAPSPNPAEQPAPSANDFAAPTVPTPVAGEVPPSVAPAALPLVAAEYRQKLVAQLSTRDVKERILLETMAPDVTATLADTRLPGVSVRAGKLVVQPDLIGNAETTATQLATLLDANYNEIYPLLLPKKLRYAKLAAHVPAPLKEQLLALQIPGLGALPEYRRVYPEGSLAAQVLGFLNHDEEGAYGVEESLDPTLKGKNGLRRTQVDPFNRQITVGDITIEHARDGADVVLTLDRAIQKTVEAALAEAVDSQRADSGQTIVMDPYTGAILALAHYPTFDPNSFGDVYTREELIGTVHLPQVPPSAPAIPAVNPAPTAEQKATPGSAPAVPNTPTTPASQTVPVPVPAAAGPTLGAPSPEPRIVPTLENEAMTTWRTAAGEEIVKEFDRDFIIRRGYHYPVFTEKTSSGELKKVIYQNRAGPGSLALKAVNEPYEPGSVFKPVVVAMALDAGEVTPQTRSPYGSPVPLNEYIGKKQIVIKNALGHYFGRENMTEILEHSSNIGMTFVAQKLGRATFYDYLKKFGFGERSDIELPGEAPGHMANYTRWTESEMVTKAFGQGITVNMVQLAAAYSALANGGLLMRPYIVAEERYPDGRKIVHEPETVRRVLSSETSATISAMLVSSVDRGFAKVGKVPGYYVAGKTGTSQTYGKNGAALFGVGSTLAGFGGYAPATNPKFVIISKVDHPRVSEWGEGSAGVIFKKVAGELLQNYYAIPPHR